MGFSRNPGQAPPRTRSPSRDDLAPSTRMFLVNPMLSTLPTLLVTTLYYFWQVYHREWRRRRHVLRQRVAYMLWVVAQRMGSPAA